MSGAIPMFILYAFKTWTGTALPLYYQDKSVYFLNRCSFNSFVRNFCFVLSDQICLWLIRLTAVWTKANLQRWQNVTSCTDVNLHQLGRRCHVVIRTSVVMGCLCMAIKKTPLSLLLFRAIAPLQRWRSCLTLRRPLRLCVLYAESKCHYTFYTCSRMH